MLAYQDSLGKIKHSRETAQQVAELAKKYDLNELPANVAGMTAIRDGFHGYAESARQRAAGLLSMSDERLARANAALALAQNGDTAQAEKRINDLNREFSDDVRIKYSYSPAVQALNLLHRNKPAEAIALLEAPGKYEMGFPIFNTTYLLTYVRGLAYSQAHDGNKAAAEFRKILDHRGLNTISVFLPLAQLQLARAYALQGDTTKARTACQDFFAIWKDADPDVPVLIAAKSEDAKLK